MYTLIMEHSRGFVNPLLNSCYTLLLLYNTILWKCDRMEEYAGKERTDTDKESDVSTKNLAGILTLIAIVVAGVLLAEYLTKQGLVPGTA